MYFASLFDRPPVDDRLEISKRFEKAFFEKAFFEKWRLVFCADLESYFRWSYRSLYVGLKIVPLFGEDKAASYMEVFYTSSVD